MDKIKHYFADSCRTLRCWNRVGLVITSTCCFTVAILYGQRSKSNEDSQVSTSNADGKQSKPVPIKADDPKIYKLIKDPIHGSIQLHPLLYRITTTPAFHRLKYIKQLSGLHYIYPGGTHTRFEHSIGVCHLAGEFSQMLIKRFREDKPYDAETQTNDKVDILCIQIAGLCHDLGHGPFSHLFESIMTRTSHEKLSSRILEEIVYHDNKELFEKYGIGDTQIQDIKNMIERTEDFKKKLPENLYLFEIVANKATGIDVDKWDYFIRDCHYMGLQHEFDYKRLMQLSRIRKVADKDGIERFRICYNEKEVNNILGMFRTRCSLHLKAYQHEKVKAVNHMLKAAIKEVMSLDLIYDRRKKKKRSINDILVHLDAVKDDPADLADLAGYLALDDGIIPVILNTDPASITDESDKEKLETSQKWLADLSDNKIPHRLSPKEVTEGLGDNKLKKLEENDKAMENIIKSVQKKSSGVFAEKVKLTYISEKGLKSPLDKLYIFEDDGSQPPRLLTDDEYETSLHLFIPKLYTLEEYWWYTTWEENEDAWEENDKAVISAIVEAYKTEGLKPDM